MTASPISAPFAVIALGLTLGACGGSGDNGLSRSQLDGKANSICQKYTAQANAVPKPKSLQDANQAVAYLERVVPIANSLVGELAGLKPAASLKGDWNAFTTKARQSSEVLSTALQKARAKDPTGLQDLVGLTALNGEINAAATKVGATECAK